MVRRAMWALVAVVCGAGEAAASGSSRVEAGGASFRVVSETPSVAFADEADALAFHQGFKEHDQGGVDWLAGRAAPVVEAFDAAHPGALAPWNPELPLVWLHVTADEAGSLELASGPIRLAAPLATGGAALGKTSGLTSLVVVFAAPPTRQDAVGLLSAVEAAVAASEADE